MASWLIQRELVTSVMMVLLLAACGNDSEVLPLADPNGEHSALVLPESQPIENNNSFLGKGIFDLDLIYDENNGSAISSVKRSLLYVNPDTSVITEDLVWDQSSLMWQSTKNEPEGKTDLFYQYWNGNGWDRIDVGAQTFYEYQDDGTLQLKVQSEDDATLSYELTTLVLQEEHDLLGRSVFIEDSNVTVTLFEGAKSYKVGSGVSQEILYVINDNNADEIIDGPALEHWDNNLEDIVWQSFPTFSSLLYAASMHEVSLGGYYKEDIVNGAKELVVGDYYPGDYQANSSFGAIRLEGTRYRYAPDGSLIEATTLKHDGGSWALGKIQGLNVLEVVGSDGGLHYFAIVEGMVRYLAVQMPGMSSFRAYYNEIAIESMVEELDGSGRLEALDLLPAF